MTCPPPLPLSYYVTVRTEELGGCRHWSSSRIYRKTNGTMCTPPRKTQYLPRLSMYYNSGEKSALAYLCAMKLLIFFILFWRGCLVLNRKYQWRCEPTKGERTLKTLVGGGINRVLVMVADTEIYMYNLTNI